MPVAALTVNTSALTSAVSSSVPSASVMVPAELNVTSPLVAALTTPNTTPPLLVVVRSTLSVLAPPSALASVATMLFA